MLHASFLPLRRTRPGLIAVYTRWPENVASALFFATMCRKIDETSAKLPLYGCYTGRLVLTKQDLLLRACSLPLLIGHSYKEDSTGVLNCFTFTYA